MLVGNLPSQLGAVANANVGLVSIQHARWLTDIGWECGTVRIAELPNRLNTQCNGLLWCRCRLVIGFLYGSV